MLEIAFRRIDSVAVLDLTGNIDLDSANFIEKIGWCLENGYPDILCNFENINLVDYAGLSVLAIAFKNVENHHGRIKLLGVAEHIKKIFSLVCLDLIIELCDDQKQAVSSFKEDRAISEIQKKKLRRRFRRLPLDIKVEFKAKDKNEVFSQGKVVNISGVGLLVVADKLYPLNEVLEAKLLLSQKTGVLEVQAKVAWLVRMELQPQFYPGMGLEFYQLEHSLQKKIVEFVERNLPLESIA